jgi:predicted acylesterase/phospholipase RssA
MAKKPPRKQSEHVAQAKKILRKKAPIPSGQECLDLVKHLKQEKAFGYARKLLGLARESRDLAADGQMKLKLAQQHALCTYKDPDLPVRNRLNRALQILNTADALLETQNRETLGLAGAIFKRKWEVSGQKMHLEHALYYYLRGFQLEPASERDFADDQGYTGINAAFVLDQLAGLEARQAQRAGMTSEVADARRKLAADIRTELKNKLPELAVSDESLNQNYWYLVTIAEACFGLSEYEQAGKWLQKAGALPSIPSWELESTARQLASVARLKAEDDPHKLDTGAWQTLEAFLGDRISGVLTAFLGKVGLALSGGGFRASLFHIGVLAKLAELDLLRHVEVISCVSGGSIIGAHYYLKVRELFKRKADGEIGRQDYVQLVQDTCREFLTGVQTNIRTRVAAELVTNLKMIFLPNYSRTMRAGELYEEKIYAAVKDGEEQHPRWLNDLYIEPKGEGELFSPKYDNWRRSAKVPILILNATSLNTGHNWQFTASWMGEPPSGIDTAIDANYRLRRMYYEDAPAPHDRIRLGHAVAASACVPGLFEPIVLPKLYERQTDPNTDKKAIAVRLVDGGVHDNQGIMSLLEQDCNAVVVSDASGQMDSDDNPSKGVIGVPLRSNSILMARVREAEYRELDARRKSGVLRNLMFIHLKKDLAADPVDWIGCDESSQFGRQRLSGAEKDHTDYGILKDVQQNLAAIRTDLDSFCDTEAFALMTSGYRMAEFELKKQFANFPMSTEDLPDWQFLAVEKAMADRPQSKRLLKLVKVGSQRAFKVWKLSTPLKITSWILGALTLVFFFWACWKWSSVALLTVGAIGTTAAALIAGAVVGKKVMRMVRYRDTLAEIAIGVAMSLLGWIVARIHLHLFDKWFLHIGRVSDRNH